MKTFLQFNVIIQVLWIIAILGLMFAPVFLLYVAFFMGINHLIFSLILVFVKGRKSQLFPHLIWSLLYLVILFVGGTIGDNFGLSAWVNRDFITFLMMAPPIVLALNYWYNTFIHLNPFKRVEHNVFDL